MRLELPHCRIRPWAGADAPALVRHADDREVWRNLREGFPHPYTAADAESWISFATRRDPPAHFAIEVEGEAAGGIGFDVAEDASLRTAEIGYWLGRRFWGRGIATEALRAVTAHAFAAHGFERLQACVFGWNAASVRVLEKCGYALEERRANAVTKGGETADVLVYAVLREGRVAAPRSPA